MNRAVVRWSARARVYAACFMGISAALALWSYSRDGVGFALVVAILLFLISTGALIHLLVFRLEANSTGISIRKFVGTKIVPWQQIQSIELIAQWHSEAGIVRQSTTDPSEAYHILVVTRSGRINLNRHMDGIDDLLTVYAQRGAFVLSDEVMQVAVKRDAHPVMRGVQAVGTGARYIEVGFSACFMTFMVSLMAAASSRFAPTGALFLDTLLISGALLSLFAAVVALARKIRAHRFGELPKAPPPTGRDLLLTYSAALMGPVFVAFFVPKVAAEGLTSDVWNVLFALVGVCFTLIPIKEFYAYSFRR